MTLALYYDLHHSHYQEDFPYWMELASKCGGPLLELGCGSGRVALPLAQAGHTVYGLDNAPDMLHVLRGKLKPGIPVHLILADLTAFRLAAVFPLILIPCNTYSTLCPEERLETIACIHAHLEPGGIFAFSMPNPAQLADPSITEEGEIEEVFDHPVSGCPVQVSSDWQRTSQGVIIRWHYDHLLPDGRAERVTAEVFHYLTETARLRSELHQSGFQTSLYGDFEKSVFNQESPLLLCQARLE